LSIQFQADPGELFVLSNEAALTRILDHLIDNAIKYTPSPGSVYARLKSTNDAISLEIEDTGVGIPKEDVGKVFERFYRGDQAHSIESGGTGIGLTIVRNLVEKTKSRIEVESEQGKGSLFRVLLPKAVK